MTAATVVSFYLDTTSDLLCLGCYGAGHDYGGDLGERCHEDDVGPCRACHGAKSINCEGCRVPTAAVGIVRYSDGATSPVCAACWSQVRAEAAGDPSYRVTEPPIVTALVTFVAPDGWAHDVWSVVEVSR